MNRTDDAATSRAGHAANVRTALIVASRRWFREGLKGLLQTSDIRSLLDAATLDECLASLRAEDRPDVAIVSLEGDAERLLKDFETISQWRERLPQTRWVVLCSTLKPSTLLAALQARVDGLFHVDISEDVLRRAVELILLGQVLFPSELSQLLLGALRPAMADLPAAAPAKSAEMSLPDSLDGAPEHVPLSPREHQILQCLVAGHPNKVIARELDIAEATVKVHIKGLLRKVKASNRTQAAIWAMNQRPASMARGSNVVKLPSAAMAGGGVPVAIMEPRPAGIAAGRGSFPSNVGIAASGD